MRVLSLLIVVGLLPAIAHAQPLATDSDSVLGTWETIDRHVAMGSLYQPVHGVRKRVGLVRFERDEEGRLRGSAVHAGHTAISNQERWTDGYTKFRSVAFDGLRLVVEWDIAEWYPTAGPIAVERQRTENKGVARIEAVLQNERFIGTWKLLLADGTEVFRGEWEAWRALGVPDESGPLMLIGGRHQDLTAELRRAFFDLAGGKDAKIIIIPTAIATADEPATQQELLQPWLDLGPRSAKILHTRDPNVANDPSFSQPLAEATAVFFTNGHQHRLFDAYRGTRLEKELLKLQAREGLIGGCGTGALVLGDRVLVRPQETSRTERGFGLLFGVVMAEQSSEDFLAEIGVHRSRLGLVLGPGAAVIIRGKRAEVLQGKVEVHLSPGPADKRKTFAMQPGSEHDLREAISDARATK